MQRRTGLKRTNKYGAVRSRCHCGQTADSKAEGEYCDLLALMKRAGEIADYQHHPAAVKMTDAGIQWRVDFWVQEPDGSEYYVEVKGLATADYKIKLELYRTYGVLPLYVVKRYGSMRFRLIAQGQPVQMNEVPLAPSPE